MAKPMTDEQHARAVIKCVQDVNAALDAFDAAVQSAAKAGLEVRHSYELSCDTARDFYAAKRFSASVERRKFIAGIQG